MAEAQQHLQQQLVIFIDFNGQHSTAITVQNLARLYQTTQDDSLLTAVVQGINITPRCRQYLATRPYPAGFLSWYDSSISAAGHRQNRV
ncbi:MAG: hypothetical protein DCF17_20170 [Shackletoniella antarctica]|uniref:Uncharacterized protein n=1 Tax=Shackletoniella antarctica TaxID=268115 RepID=A0A2W4XFI9_9CYAN|nr:MAG: hypothetical protein DCF17_20170 [Shackletoniella antarctica]